MYKTRSHLYKIKLKFTERLLENITNKDKQKIKKYSKKLIKNILKLQIHKNKITQSCTYSKPIKTLQALQI